MDYPELLDATEEWELAIEAFFQRRGVPMRPAAWLRAFGEDTPVELRARPRIVVRDGVVHGFLIVRPVALETGDRLIQAVVLEDYLVDEGREGEIATRLFLEQLPRAHDLALAVGWSEEGVKALRAWHWLFCGTMSRWVIKPPRRNPAIEKGGGEGWRPEAGKSFMAERDLGKSQALFIVRPTPWEARLLEGDFLFLPILPNFAESGYVKLAPLNAASVGRREFLAADVRCGPDYYAQAVAVITQAAWDLQADIYLSHQCPLFDQELAAAKAERLTPRWGVFAVLGERSDKELLRNWDIRQTAHLFATDFGLDL